MDKKKYYTSPDNYRDIDGNMKTFTYVDHDIKPSISAHLPETKTEREEREEWMADYLEWRIELVLLLPAVNIVGVAGGIYDFLVKRTDTIDWDKKAVRTHLTEDKDSFLPTLLWKRTVLMANWHHPMWMEDDREAIRRGDWKTLT